MLFLFDCTEYAVNVSNKMTALANIVCLIFGFIYLGSLPIKTAIGLGLFHWKCVWLCKYIIWFDLWLNYNLKINCELFFEKEIC